MIFIILIILIVVLAKAFFLPADENIAVWRWLAVGLIALLLILFSPVLLLGFLAAILSFKSFQWLQPKDDIKQTTVHRKSNHQKNADIIEGEFTEVHDHDHDQKP